jgi:geranylgeranyl diphosphate synthase type II
MARGDSSGPVDSIEAALQQAVADITLGGPPGLRGALQHAVFPGGARLRPRLSLAVAAACGAPVGDARALASAIATELFHCGSLAHDDLPCFDDAATRRGRPSVHAAFGQPLAVLAGDALIAGGFEVVAQSFSTNPRGLAGVVRELAQSLGASRGIIAGQAWESEPTVDVSSYHRAKTGALFEAAAAVGALSMGADPEPFRGVGACFGEAYQVLDDVADATRTAASLGKPTRRDLALERPSAVDSYGVEGALARAGELLARARDRMPSCPRPDLLDGWLKRTADEVVRRMVHAA